MGALRRLRPLVIVATALCAVWPTAASAGPPSTRLIGTAGRLVPIPAAIPHQEGATIDSRIVPDLRWIASHFPVYVTEGYSGPLPNGEYSGCHGCHARHSDHYNGLAVDIVPLHPSPRCDANWRGVTRLAHWAEPVQNHPIPPFRWVGYEGDAGHGCGNHLHLSWEHAPAPSFQLAEWVEVFPVPHAEATPPPSAPQQPPSGLKPERRRRPRRPKRPQQPAGPIGGISRSESGGVSPTGD